MKLRTAILGSLWGLVALIVLVTVAALTAVLRRAATRDISADLQRSVRSFESQRQYREALYRAQAQVVAEEPRLKAVVATEDVSPETVAGVAHQLEQDLGSDLLVVTDGQGRLVADADNPTAGSPSMAQNPVIQAALGGGQASGIWTTADGAFQVAGQRIGFGERTVGAVAVGYRIDDKLAQAVAERTGAGVVVERDGQVIASAGLGAAARPALQQALATVATGAQQVSQVSLGAERYLAVAAAIPGAHGAQLRAVLLRSLDRALAPARSLTWALFGLAALMLVLSLFMAQALSSRLAAPVHALVGFTGELAAGRLETRLTPAGATEIRQLAQAMNGMASELQGARQVAAARERLQKEMEIAARIQLSILPRKLNAPGLEVAASMLPASEVGGDYYDVVPLQSGCWVGIGDVAGHGLTAGLVMMMIQSVLAALCKQSPDAPPRTLLVALNAVLYENIRVRLANDEHVTLSLLRIHPDGRVVYAGAHEEILVWRARTGTLESLATPGVWLGGMKDISGATVDSTFQLEPGDTVVLHTDGVTEAMNAKREQFGSERLHAAIRAAASKPVEAVRDGILGEVAAWTAQQFDDVTVLVFRYRGQG